MNEQKEVSTITIKVPTTIKQQLKNYFQQRGLNLSNGVRQELYRLLEKNVDESR